MDFQYSQKSDPYPHWEYLNLKNHNRLRVVPERGGLITEWRCNDKEMLYFDRERFSQTNLSVRGGIPILFPICGDLPEDQLLLPGGIFHLKQHGFARNSLWKIKLLDDGQGINLVLNSNRETLACFPYEFNIKIEARLIKNALKITTKIKNKSLIKMPFNFGLHPYFNISDLNKIEIKGLPKMSIDQFNMLEVNTNEQLKLVAKGIDMISESIGPISLSDLLTGDSLKLEFEIPMDLAVIWTDPPRKMICIEPWTSPRQSILSGKRRMNLDPGQTCFLVSRFIYN
tara:strand:+ start:1606 stop:2460 length:855 start_codon:yes stop_codon:yes gene_type:complete